tara:strand:- start:92 stop:529 length:438 start_codon:yes stop_codon:yes gene_type:complete
MAQTFNGATLAFTDNSATPLTYQFNVRDFSEAGNDRAAIDVTTSASTRRQVVYAYAEATEFTFECVYDKDAAQIDPDSLAITRDVLEDLLAEPTGTLALKFIDDSEAPPPTDDFGGNRTAVVKGFTFSGEVDGVIVYSITFGILH